MQAVLQDDQVFILAVSFPGSFSFQAYGSSWWTDIRVIIITSNEIYLDFVNAVPCRHRTNVVIRMRTYSRLNASYLHLIFSSPEKKLRKSHKIDKINGGTIILPNHFGRVSEWGYNCTFLIWAHFPSVELSCAGRNSLKISIPPKVNILLIRRHNQCPKQQYWIVES